MKKISVFITISLFFAGSALLAQGAKGMHSPGGSNNCLDCHDLHGAGIFGPGDPLLSTTPNGGGQGATVKDDFCQSCHGPAGPAPEMQTHVNDGASGNGYNFPGVRCLTCHTPHRNAALPNIKNVRKKISYQDTGSTPNSGFTGSRTVQFTSRYEYALGGSVTGAYGICEVCHTNTSTPVAFHTSDGGSFAGHYTYDWGPTNKGTSTICVGCHKHTGNFWAPDHSGSQECIDCHAVNQGTRGGVAGEFSATGMHFALNGTPLTSSKQCAVCHEMAGHTDGKVRLKDPDDANHVIEFSKFTAQADLNRNCGDFATQPTCDASASCVWTTSCVDKDCDGSYATQSACDAATGCAWNYTGNDGAGVCESSATGDVTQDFVMNNFCFKCHDGDGAADPFNNSIVTNTAAPFDPFNTAATVVNVDGQFAITNIQYHPVKGYRNNPFVNANTLVPAIASLKAAGTTLNCWDCHEVQGHGGQFSDMTNLNTASDAPVSSAAYSTLQINFCRQCHSDTVYVAGDASCQTGGGPFTAFWMGCDQGHPDMAGNTGNDHYEVVTTYGCRMCHAGLVDESGLAGGGNNAGKGNIHGSNWQWPSYADQNQNFGVQNSGRFLMGGFVSGWVYIGTAGPPATTATYGACWAGNCAHNNQGGSRPAGRQYN